MPHFQAFHNPGVIRGGLLARALGDADFPVGAFGRNGDVILLLIEAFQLGLHDAVPLQPQQND